MQRDGERAGLEGVVLLWGTERTYVIAAPSRGRRSNDSGRLNSGWFKRQYEHRGACDVLRNRPRLNAAKSSGCTWNQRPRPR
eukprot:scaffold1792_cov42-Phaeocystis_antarctica.AAC.1